MTNYLTADTDLTAVANAIRTKGGTSAPLTFPAGFVSAVEAIETGSGGSDATLITKTITENGTYAATDDNADGFSSVTVNVPVGWSTLDIAQNKAPNGRLEIIEGISLGNYAFANKPITNLFAPNATVGYSSFNSCGDLQTAVFRETASTNQFSSCIKLKAADTKNHVRQNQFAGCTTFDTLVIRSATVVSLVNTSAFNNTPFASGKSGGTLYVPSALVSSYQSATNWSTILGYTNNQILPIEGSIYETQYVDGTPIG